MSALPSLKQLHYLVALSTHLNFTRAAETCFVTQSTLSAGLKELEEILGVQLVERDRQSVLMTAIGLEIAARAREILAATQDLVDRAAGVEAPMCGALRFGIIPTIAPFLLPASLRLLRERYPRLRLTLREDLTANLIERLEDGQLDVALIALPFATGTLLVEPLFDDPLWIVGSAEEPLLQQNSPQSPPETAFAMTAESTERLLLLEEGHCLRDHTLQSCGKPARQSQGSIEATSLLTLIQMVESGLGLALIPEMAVNSGLADRASRIASPAALAAGLSSGSCSLRLARADWAPLVALPSIHAAASIRARSLATWSLVSTCGMWIIMVRRP